MNYREFYSEIKPDKKDYSFLYIFLILLLFKLSGISFVSDWTWWEVTFPLWAPVLLYAITLFAYTTVWIILKVGLSINKFLKKKFRK
jgi:hypothetical protein